VAKDAVKGAKTGANDLKKVVKAMTAVAPVETKKATCGASTSSKAKDGKKDVKKDATKAKAATKKEAEKAKAVSKKAKLVG